MKFMKNMKIQTVVAFMAVGIIGYGNADEEASMLSVNTVWDLPPLEADRPDVTESPMTVPKGMWQLEMTVAGWSRDEADGDTTRTWSFGEINMKYGLTGRDDIQIGFDLYARERSAGDSAEGFGDVVIRWKHNLLGFDDESPVAVAAMPYVKIPTGTELSNGQIEGGFVLPAAMDLNDRVSLGAQIEPSYLFDEDSDDHQFALGHTVALAVDLGGSFGTYVEYVGMVTESDYEAGLSGGFTYDVNSNFRLDVGAYFGLNDSAEDFAGFTGFTCRF